MLNRRIIASLTTHSKRINTVHLAINTIINQTRKVDKIVLSITEGEYKKNELPKELLLLKKDGLEIIFCYDIKVYEKLIPALKKYPNDLIITFDDDVLYDNTIVEKLVCAYEKEPNVIHCARGHRIRYTKDGYIRSYNAWEYCSNVFESSYDIFPTGCGGVLYFPGCFHDDVLNDKLFLKLSPKADDVWFKAMSLKKGIKCKILKQENNKYMNLKLINDTQDIGLCNTNIDEIYGNNLQIKNVFEYYNIYHRDYINQITTKKMKRYCPICDKHAFNFNTAGVANRADALCPNCNSLERDRLNWLYINNRNQLRQDNIKILHIAPEKCLEEQFKKVTDYYISADLYDKRAMIKMDITDNIFKDGYFDFIYCSHVLEHIIDDRKAMKEFYRILSDDGVAILNVPIESDGVTYEDFTIVEPQDRLKAFGQIDHVRNYGLDYKQRLEECGWHVNVITGKDFLSEYDRLRMAVEVNTGEIYVCVKK